MIWRTLALVLLSVFGSLARGETFVYLSVAAEKRIAVYQLDSETGKLTHKSDCPVAAGEPGALTVDPEKRFLLAAIRSTGKLASFRLDAATGKLTYINTVTVGPDPAHISTDRTGRYLLTAYYVDAKVGIYEIKGDMLKVCYFGSNTGKRPADFSTKDDRNIAYIVLTRAKK